MSPRDASSLGGDSGTIVCRGIRDAPPLLARGNHFTSWAVKHQRRAATRGANNRLPAVGQEHRINV
eukprot:3470920-Prymnesium_polylepis.1